MKRLFFTGWCSRKLRDRSLTVVTVSSYTEQQIIMSHPLIYCPVLLSFKNKCFSPLFQASVCNKWNANDSCWCSGCFLFKLPFNRLSLLSAFLTTLLFLLQLLTPSHTCFNTLSLSLFSFSLQYNKPSDVVVPEMVNGLKDNLDVVVSLAERHYYNCDFKMCYKLTSM